jgi:DNA-binding MarR family transcriptional regulator
MSDLDLADDLRAAVGDFVRRVRANDTMPPGQAAVLGHLDRGGPLSIADLARREQVRHQSMTRTVGLLKDQGLVTAAPHADDGRVVVLTITDAGVRALDQGRHSRAAGIADAIRTALTPAERELVARVPALLRKLQP